MGYTVFPLYQYAFYNYVQKAEMKHKHDNHVCLFITI